MDARTRSESRSVLVRSMGPVDADSAWPRPLCEEAAGLAATRHSGRRIVTAGTDRPRSAGASARRNRAAPTG